MEKVLRFGRITLKGVRRQFGGFFQRQGCEWFSESPLSQIVYDYDDDFGDWEIEGTLNLTYDLTVPSNVIAGIENFYNSFTSVNNKILTIEETQYNDGIPTVTIPYTLYYSEATGIGEHNGSQIAIWPNPASETLSLNAEGLQQVEIFTIDGRQVMHFENNLESINVNTLANGC